MATRVILQENVENLGRTGDIVKVRDGYARNFLVPRWWSRGGCRRAERSSAQPPEASG